MKKTIVTVAVAQITTLTMRLYSHVAGNTFGAGTTGAWCNCAYRCRVNVTRNSTNREATGSPVLSFILVLEESLVPQRLRSVAGLGSKRVMRTPALRSVGSPEQ